MKRGAPKGTVYRRDWDMTEGWNPSRPKLTIEDILEIAGQIYKETGRYLSYGAVCTKIYAGRIDPEHYLGRRVQINDQYRA